MIYLDNLKTIIGNRAREGANTVYAYAVRTIDYYFALIIFTRITRNYNSVWILSADKAALLADLVIVDERITKVQIVQVDAAPIIVVLLHKPVQHRSGDQPKVNRLDLE